MKRYNSNWFSLLFALFLVYGTAMASIPERPDPPRLVNDFAALLTAQQSASLEDMLSQFAVKTSTRIVVVTVKSLDGYDPADYAFRVGEKWGVGQKGKDNGIVMLVKPKTAVERGRAYIAVGYGLEDVIPDAVANTKIINNEMLPRFKENDYYGGILNGTRVIMDLAQGKFTATQYAEKAGQEPRSNGFLIVLLILVFVVIPAMTRRRGTFSAGSRSLPFWLLMGAMSGGRSPGSNWGSFSSGRGSFGGFGGGSFGGGGAGGSW